MKHFKHIYGPIPSRRLGRSLGISVTTEKTCNFNCIYCQVGKTVNPLRKPENLLNIDDVNREFEAFLQTDAPFDMVSIVGNGEPTLEINLGELIDAIKKKTKKPVALITNGSLFHIESVFRAAMKADIVLPSINGYDEQSFRRIHRPVKGLTFSTVFDALKTFTHAYEGQLWLEIMFMARVNDHDDALAHYQRRLNALKYDRLYLNTVVRPPAKEGVMPTTQARMKTIAKHLKGITIDWLADGGFASSIKDDYDALISLIRHHPMHQHEIEAFLNTRNGDTASMLKQLSKDPDVESIDYKGFTSFRLS